MNLVQRLFSLQKHTDAEGVTREIKDNVSVSGFNAWMLICSALVASIGLDLNSSAVIIGAMLISPLMSPILGVGLAVGIYDTNLLTRAIKHWGIAIALSIGTSFMYFLITPLGEISTEIIARTQPTLLDVVVAFFGGVAGIVANSRDQKTNVVPGAAIATALMPPLCVCGFGLAKGQWIIFSGAGYLFFLNAAFISFATILMVKYLHFPRAKYIDNKARKQINHIIAVFLFLITLPSVFFLFTVYDKVRDKSTVQKLVISELSQGGNEVIKWDVIHTDSIKTVKVYFSGSELKEGIIDSFHQVFEKYDLKDYRLNLFRINITKKEIAQMNEEARIELVRSLALESRLQKTADSLARLRLPNIQQLQKEVQVFDTSLTISRMGNLVGTDSVGRIDTILSIRFKRKLQQPVQPQPQPRQRNRRSNNETQAQATTDSARTNSLYKFLLARLNKDTVSVAFE